MENEIDILVARLEAIIKNEVRLNPTPTTAYDEPSMADVVRKICHRLLEASNADGNGGCDLCRS